MPKMPPRCQTCDQSSLRCDNLDPPQSSGSGITSCKYLIFFSLKKNNFRLLFFFSFFRSLQEVTSDQTDGIYGQGNIIFVIFYLLNLILCYYIYFTFFLYMIFFLFSSILIQKYVLEHLKQPNVLKIFESFFCILYFYYFQ